MQNLSPLFLDGRVLLDADRILQAGLADRRASFELAMGTLPPNVGFAVVSGVETLLSLLSLALVDVNDLEEIQRIVGFSDALTQRLARFMLRVDIDAVPDGTIAFARTPIASIEGPFIEAALISAMVRDTITRGTWIATRAARLHIASGGEPVIDGSSVRAPSPSASLALARAAHIGGSSATTNLLAAAMLGIPFREASSLELGVIAPPGASDDAWGAAPVWLLGPNPIPVATPGGSDDAWGESHADLLVELGAGDDEELCLVEAKRIGARAGGWIARSICAGDPTELSVSYDLVALEEDGAWSPRRGARGDALPGRKRITRYLDAAGRAVADVVHLQNERMQSPRARGAATLVSLALTVMRAGQLIAAPESPAVGRERAIAARATLRSGVTQLRRPEAYLVELSPGVIAMRDTLDVKAKLPQRGA
jgi:nicotinate phosphoribosyltransferase